MVGVAVLSLHREQATAALEMAGECSQLTFVSCTGGFA